MSREDVLGDVVRPSIPATLWVTAAFWLGLMAAESLTEQGAVAMLGACVLICVVAGALALSRRGSVGIVCLALGVGLIVGAMAWAVFDRRAGTLTLQRTGEWEGVVSSDPRLLGDAVGFEMATDGAGGRATLGVIARGAGEVRRGMLVRVSGRVAEGGEYTRRDRRSGVHGRVDAWAVELTGWRGGPLGAIARLRERARIRLDDARGPGGDLLCGIALGDRTRIRGTPLEADARTSGIAHLLAVSGTHLAVMAGFAAALGGALRLSRGRVLALTLGVCVLYVLLTGVQDSSVRALGVVVAYALATTGGRRGDPLAAVGITVLGFLLLDPHAAFSVGLALSTLAMCGIVLFAPLVTAWVQLALPGKLEVIAAPIAVCIVAQAVTAPITAPLFAQLPVVGVIANLVAVPLATLALPVGVVGLGLSLAGLPGGWLLGVASFLLARVADVASALAASRFTAVPLTGGWTTSVAIAGAFAAVWAFWPRPTHRSARLLVGAVALALLVGGAPVPGAIGGGGKLVVLDVGQGDAILVVDGGRSLLVDAGDDGRTLRRALARHGVRRLDAVFVTHGHADHSGGLEGLGGMIAPGTVRVSAAADTEGLPQPVMRRLGPALAAGDQVRVGETTIDVLWPPAEIMPAEENEASLVLLVRREGFSALLTGDAEEPIYERLARSGLLPRDVDVVKVPHHGSEGGLSRETLAHVSPEVAVISVGAGNEFGHPTREALRTLGEAGAGVMRTDEVGDVAVVHEGDRFTVSGQESGAGAYETMPTSARTRIATEGYSRDVRRPVRPQAGLPDLRLRGTPARAGGEPSEEALRRGGRSRLQHEGLRRGERRGLRDRRRSQHAAVHVRAPPCRGASSRQAEDR